jgi:hypothetical protein
MIAGTRGITSELRLRRDKQRSSNARPSRLFRRAGCILIPGARIGNTGTNRLWMLSSGQLWGRHANLASPRSGSGHHRRPAAWCALRRDNISANTSMACAPTRSP